MKYYVLQIIVCGGCFWIAGTRGIACYMLGALGAFLQLIWQEGRA